VNRVAARAPRITASRMLAAGGVAVLLVVATVAPVRPVGLIVIATAWFVLAALRRPEAIGWAAALPVAIALSWPWVMGGDVPLGPAGCTDPLSEIVVRRGVLALSVLAAVAGLAWLHRSNATELALRRPLGVELVLAVAGLLVLAVAGLVIGPLVAEPFFGRIEFERPLGALLPAVVFGVSNGVLEELAYRGALQGWLTRSLGAPVAVGAQALAFGLVHAGPEVLTLLPVHVTLIALVGLGAGLLVRWTGSLAIPIGIHIGADIALYVGLACRAPA
jgi:membrane protease YdiL (CAAX protease family)